jgi:hypothetical protein
VTRFPALLVLPLLAASPAPQERRFLLTGFDRVRVDGPFEVEVVEGSPAGSAFGDGPATDRVAMQVSGSTLVVRAGPGAWAARPGERIGTARIRIQAPALRGIQLSGGGRVRIAAMRGDRVDIGLNGAGSIDIANVRADSLGLLLNGGGAVTLAGSAVQARLRNSGAGSIDAAALTVDDAVIVAETVGATRVTVRYTAQVVAAGIGTVSVLGHPKCKVSGAGPVDCADIERRR